MRTRHLLVAGYLGLTALLGVGGMLGMAWLRVGQDDRQSKYRWENGRCYRLRFALHGALASARYETSAEHCSKAESRHALSGMDWLAVADCHFVDCAASSLTASIAKQKDFVSYIGYGPNQQEACENAKSQLREMLNKDHCTPTECSCYKVERSSPQARSDDAHRSRHQPGWLPG